MTDRKKPIEEEIAIDAPVDAVWSALTDSDELANWFPLSAKVDREKSTLFISWGPGCEGEQKIQVWDENRLFRAGDDYGVVEYTLDAQAGRTNLRMVQSNFGAVDWSDETYESMSVGWKFELAGLKHYLERHRGIKRHCAWARHKTGLPMSALWDKVFPLFGSPNPAGRYDIVTATGERFFGRMLNLKPPRTFTGFVENWNDGMLRVELSGMENSEAWVWLSTWGVPVADVKAFEDRWSAKLREAVP